MKFKKTKLKPLSWTFLASHISNYLKQEFFPFIEEVAGFRFSHLYKLNSSHNKLEIHHHGVVYETKESKKGRSIDS